MATWTELEAELLRVGEFVENNYEGDFMVAGRPITNFEMMADRFYTRTQRERRIAEYGCCGEGRDSAGRCYGHGLCPLFLKAKEMVRHGG